MKTKTTYIYSSLTILVLGVFLGLYQNFSTPDTATDAATDTSATASPDGSAITKTSKMQKIVDKSATDWALSGGEVVKSGKADKTTSYVETVLYYKGNIYYQTTSNVFHEYKGSTWVASSDPRVISASGTKVASGADIVDAGHNVWTIVGGLVYENGEQAGYAYDIVQLEYLNGAVQAENSSGKIDSWSGSAWVAVSTASTGTALPAAVQDLCNTNKAMCYSHQEFYDDFSNPDQNIDLKNTHADGFHWYVSSPGNPEHLSTLTNVIAKANNGKMLHMKASNPVTHTFLNGVNLNSKGEVVGTTFKAKNGGGAYFEARIAYGNTGASEDGWPSFWMNPSDKIVGLDSKVGWGGVNSYIHYVEMDIMEYFYNNSYSTYAPHTNLIDWYGEFGKGPCPAGQYCQVQEGRFYVNSAKKGDFTSASDSVSALKFHTYGALWVPLTSANKKGYVQFYMDGQPYLSPITWTEAPPTTHNSTTEADLAACVKKSATATCPAWLHSIMDKQEMALTLDTGSGGFMWVDYVQVYQLP